VSVENIVVWGVLIVIAIYLIIIYNGLVALKHAVSKNFSNIDVLLKQRFEELPPLIEVCKGYMRHEKETLELVIRARNQVASAQRRGDIKALGRAETSLRGGLDRIFALAEDYPELKANENFKHLQVRISQLENAIADRREVYNEAVNNNNTRLEQFPDVLVARLFGFKKADLLKFSAFEKQNVNVGRLLNS